MKKDKTLMDLVMYMFIAIFMFAVDIALYIWLWKIDYRLAIIIFVMNTIRGISEKIKKELN